MTTATYNYNYNNYVYVLYYYTYYNNYSYNNYVDMSGPAGLVRAALLTITGDSTFSGRSERSKVTLRQVKNLIAQIFDEKKSIASRSSAKSF